MAWRLASMLLIAAMHGVALIHHLSSHTLPIASSYTDHLPTPATAGIPSGWESNNTFSVIVVLFVALRSTTTITALAEIVVCKTGMCGGGDRGRASVCGVGMTLASQGAGLVTTTTGLWARAYVGSNVRIIVAFSVDADELATAIV